MYVGGKSRIAKHIVRAIRQHSPEATVAVEPFMGGGAVTAELAKEFDTVLASDAHPDLVMMWQAVLNGWAPPEIVTEDEWRALRHAEPSALRGFAGFACSFGGKWFGGYARGRSARGESHNYAAQGSRSVMRGAESLTPSCVTVSHTDYLSVSVPQGSVLYLDPPYANTQGYTTGGFDSVEFWAWAEAQSEAADVYVSEVAAPSGWTPVWGAPVRQRLAISGSPAVTRTEQLFTIERRAQ